MKFLINLNDYISEMCILISSFFRFNETSGSFIPPSCAFETEEGKMCEYGLINYFQVGELQSKCSCVKICLLTINEICRIKQPVIFPRTVSKERYLSRLFVSSHVDILIV